MPIGKKAMAIADVVSALNQNLPKTEGRVLVYLANCRNQQTNLCAPSIEADTRIFSWMGLQ
jgi:hypothetical protein